MSISQSSVKEIAEQLKKEFPEAAIGITGCRSSGSPHPTCEYNYLIVIEGKKRIEKRLLNNNSIELLFLNKDSIQDFSDQRLILALIDMNVISDPSWILIPIVHKIKNDSTKYLQQYAKNILFKSLSRLGRFQDSIDTDNVLEAGFWLLSSANIFAKAIIASNNKIPRNSHMLNEFRICFPVSTDMFEIWSDASGVKLATKVAVIRRLDALRELLKVGSVFSNSTVFSQPENAYKFTEATCNYLVKNHAIVDAYCYIGLEITRAIEELYEFKCKIKDKPPLYHEMFSQLSIKDKSLSKISKQTIRLIGINSEKQMLIEQSTHLERIIKKVAKNTISE